MKNVDEITGLIIRAAMKVHSALGPGLLESAYKACLIYELKNLGLNVTSEVPLPIVYEKVNIDTGYRIDLLVEDQVIVELKSVDSLQPIHQAQLLSYLRLAKRRVGLLINFNVVRLKEGIKRMMNGYEPA